MDVVDVNVDNGRGLFFRGWVALVKENLKGIVHPKMLSLITHPRIVPNL